VDEIQGCAAHIGQIHWPAQQALEFAAQRCKSTAQLRERITLQQHGYVDVAAGMFLASRVAPIEVCANERDRRLPKVRL